MDGLEQIISTHVPKWPDPGAKGPQYLEPQWLCVCKFMIPHAAFHHMVILTCPAWIPTCWGHNKWNKLISWLYPPVGSNPGAHCPQMWSHTAVWIAASKCGPCWTSYGGKLGSIHCIPSVGGAREGTGHSHVQKKQLGRNCGLECLQFWGPGACCCCCRNQVAVPRACSAKECMNQQL